MATRETQLQTGRRGVGAAEGEADGALQLQRLMVRVAGIAVPLLLFAAALGLRLPYLMEVPGFTDETIDVEIGLGALHGRWPLVDAEPYIGSLFNYLLAGGFLALGQNGWVARFVVTLLGALTVVLAYFLARRMAGSVAALLAGGLMATSGVHIANGHIAWSNCTTPFFTTATMLALVEATALGNGPLLVGAGVLFGLSLQTHASVAFLIPALVLHFLIPASRSSSSSLIPRRALLRTPWPYLAVAAALLAYGNVIAYNLLNPGAWETAARQKEYAYVGDPTLESYLLSLEGLATAILRMVASSFGGAPSLLGQSVMPTNLPYLVALLWGFGHAVRRRQLLPPLGVVGTVLLMPYLNKNYDFPIGIRYLGFLLPLLYLLMAMPLARVLEALWRRSRPGAAVLASACLLLAALPVSNLFGYYEGYLRQGATSPTILALGAEIRERYQAGLVSEVLLDTQLDWLFTAPGGRALRALDSLFTVEGVPHRSQWMVPQEVKVVMEGTRKPVVLIMSAASRQRVGEGFGLVPMEVPPRPYLSRDRYWAYLLQPRPPSPR